MKFFKVTVVVWGILSICFSSSFAQQITNQNIKGKNDTIRVALTNVDGELIPWVPIRDIYVYSTRLFRSADDQARYNRLRYNVLKVLPYAIYARNRYNRLNQELAGAKNKKEQRKMVNACESEIKDMFNREIKNMTITQGEILIKLIDRETGNSSYDMVKDLKGGFTAFFYQSVARIFGHNLKSRYDPQEDRDIEAIIESSYYRYY